MENNSFKEMVANYADQTSERLTKLFKEYSERPDYYCYGIEVTSINTRTKHGDHPINIAAADGAIEDILLLLHSGADINTIGEYNYTPLHEAVEWGHLEAVKLLVKHGADTTAKNNSGNTPIELANREDQKDIYQFLINL